MFLEYDVDGERSGVHLKGGSFLHTPDEGEPPVSSREECLVFTRDRLTDSMRSTLWAGRQNRGKWQPARRQSAKNTVK